MESTIKRHLLQATAVAGTTVAVVLLSVISMQHGQHAIFPYFLLIPVLFVVWFWPKYGVIYSVLLGWIYITIVYFFFPGDISVLAGSTAWFFILVSIGIVMSSFSFGQKREERKYQAIYESSQAGLFTCTPDLKQITGSNPQLGILLGYDTAYLPGKDFTLILPDAPSRESFFSALKDSGHVRNREVQLLTQRKGLLWVLLSAAFVDETTVICSVIDLSDRKKAEDILLTFNEILEEGIKKRTTELNAALREQVTLLREIHHRVKNNLQLIASLLNLQLRRTDDEKVRMALKESQNRVRAMAIVHQKHNASEGFTHVDLQECIRFMVLQIYQTFNTDAQRINLTIDAKDVMIEIDTAITINLIINELVTNSLNYAFLSNQNGKIEILVSRKNGKIVLIMGDTGVGMPPGLDWKQPTTLGLMIVTQLVQQMHGTIEKLDGSGTVFKIILEERPAVTIHSVFGVEQSGVN
ncbi:MAG: histidine kinase dimerization/phosphoacceptor domain -containing protein [Methanoregula sp.]|nr:histidine kinase dimerization/phosphoacceptor domain -containing protein [Methanoregula sp.]